MLQLCFKCNLDRIGQYEMIQDVRVFFFPVIKMQHVVITFGTFDLLHIGHINILERSRKLGNKLVVGVSSDLLSMRKKGRTPLYNENDRMKIVRSLSFVDDVFLEESLEKKEEYILRHGARTLVMGDDWEGKFDYLEHVCEIVYLPRTKGISTSATILDAHNIN